MTVSVILPAPDGKAGQMKLTVEDADYGVVTGG
jgi:hypothetical protein